MIGLNERGQQAGIFKGDGYKGLAALLNIVLLHKDEFISYKEEVELHLKSIFSTSASIEMNDEFLCAALIELDYKIIACGLGYHRKMYQGDHCFKAGIIGSVAVQADFQQQGLCRTIIQQIDACLISESLS